MRFSYLKNGSQINNGLPGYRRFRRVVSDLNVFQYDLPLFLWHNNDIVPISSWYFMVLPFYPTQLVSRLVDITSIENAWKKLWLLARVVVLYAVVLSGVLKEVGDLPSIPVRGWDAQKALVETWKKKPKNLAFSPWKMDGWKGSRLPKFRFQILFSRAKCCWVQGGYAVRMVENQCK